MRPGWRHDVRGGLMSTNHPNKLITSAIFFQSSHTLVLGQMQGTAPEAYYYGGGETHGFSSVRENMHFFFIEDKILATAPPPPIIWMGAFRRFRRL